MTDSASPGAPGLDAASLATLSALADNLPQPAWMAAPDGKSIWFNKPWYDYTGTTEEQMLSGAWRNLHDPEHVAAIAARWRRAMETGEPYETTLMLRGADATTRPFLARATPIRNIDGAILAWLGTCTDISALEAASAELAEQKRLLEILNRTAASVAAELNLERLVQMVTDVGVELTGAEFGAFFYNVVTEQGEAWQLYTVSGVDRENFTKFPYPRETAVFAPTFKAAAIVRSDDITLDPRYGHNAPYKGMPEGHLPVRSYLAAPVRSRSGEALGSLLFGHSAPGIFTASDEQLIVGIAAQAAVGIDNSRLYDKAQREIEERRQAEEARLVVLRELNHRVKNLFAVASGMVTMTARTSGTTMEMAETLTGRLRALAEAHDLIRPNVSSEDQKATRTNVSAIITRILAAHVTNPAEQLRLEGPEIPVGPTGATSLALILHEVATNAAKYGSLSTSGGSISIVWRIEGPNVVLTWTEQGGPAVAGPPQRKGFGADLARMSAKGQLGGEVAHDWRPEGVQITLRAALDRLSA